MTGRRTLIICLVAAVVLAACGGSSSNVSGPTTRTVLADYDFDEFPVSAFTFFPRVVAVHPGDTVDFKQAWTGEPHTVTLGTAVRALGEAVAPYIKGTAAIPEKESDVITAGEQQVPSVFGENDSINQTAAAPCYIDDGPIPTDGKRCRTTEQPAFNGRQVFFNSGFIPYEGNNGNHFKLRLADDIAPGEYYYYCLLHGAPMGGYLEVKPRSERVASQAEINRKARAEFERAVPRLRTTLERAKQDSGAPSGDIVAGGFSAHIPNGFSLPFASVNEFSPKSFHAKVGQKVTWIVADGPGHTVSFHVPRYLPALEIAKNGTAKLNPLAYEPQGGSPTPPRNSGSTESIDQAPQFTPIDAGNYDGSFFLSSGYPDGPILYSVTFTKAGTYDYACLLHPRMVGKVVVS